ncbi:MAG: hypothetical protein KC417_14510, partial [Myxococcales bacterium]|nr:hypothetical protein [Myxococcales bacterium]
MKFVFSQESLPKLAVDAIAIGVHSGALNKSAAASELNKALGGDLERAAKDEGFKGETGELLKLNAGAIK